MTYCVSEFVAEEISIGNISSWQKLNRIKIRPGYTTSLRNCIVHCVKKMKIILKLVQRGECWWLQSETICLSKPLLRGFFYLILEPEAPSQVESVGHRKLFFLGRKQKLWASFFRKPCVSCRTAGSPAPEPSVGLCCKASFLAEILCVHVCTCSNDRIPPGWCCCVSRDSLFTSLPPPSPLVNCLIKTGSQALLFFPLWSPCSWVFGVELKIQGRFQLLG